MCYVTVGHMALEGGIVYAPGRACGWLLCRPWKPELHEQGRMEAKSAAYVSCKNVWAGGSHVCLSRVVIDVCNTCEMNYLFV